MVKGPKRESSLKLMVSKQTESGYARSKHHRGTTMNHDVGIDVSWKLRACCNQSVRFTEDLAFAGDLAVAIHNTCG